MIKYNKWIDVELFFGSLVVLNGKELKAKERGVGWGWGPLEGVILVFFNYKILCMPLSWLLQLLS